MRRPTRGPIVDPVLAAAAAAVWLVLHGVVRAATAVAVGDDLPLRSGRLGAAPRALADVAGTAVVPVLLALAGAVPLGWAPRVPLAPDAPARRVAPVSLVALAVLVGGAVVPGPPDEVRVAAAGLAVLQALPLPGTDVGALVGLVLRGAAGRRWASWTRRSPSALHVLTALLLLEATPLGAALGA